MSKVFTLVSPVKEEEFRLSFGHTEEIQEIVDPAEIFAPTIAHFKKMAVGTYFWLIANTAKWLTVDAGGSLEKMLPIQKSELVKNSPEVLFSNIHPEHVPHMLAFSNYWVNFYNGLPVERRPHVKASIYIRMRNIKNTYSWFMIQYVDNIIDSEGKILFGLTLVTDISHIKKDAVPAMSILDTSCDDCQQFLFVDGKSLKESESPLPKLSAREIEVLYYLSSGYSSKQIASELKIALKTIDNHRQNMLHKTKTKTTGELVAYAINMGYI